MRIIVAGGRDIKDPDRLYRNRIASLLIENGCTETVSGRCPSGADLIGEMAADDIGLCTAGFPADWNRYGPPAGPIRNAEMADYADMAILLPGGKGTASMKREMLSRNKRIVEIPDLYENP